MFVCSALHLRGLPAVQIKVAFMPAVAFHYLNGRKYYGIMS